MQIGRFTPYENLGSRAVAGAASRQSAPPESAKAAVAGLQDEGTIVGSVPLAPSEEARRLVARAAEVVDELHAHNRELHFSRDDDSGRLIIEVRDLDGKVLKTIPPSKALDIMSGAEL